MIRAAISAEPADQRGGRPGGLRRHAAREHNAQRRIAVDGEVTTRGTAVTDCPPPGGGGGPRSS